MLRSRTTRGGRSHKNHRAHKVQRRNIGIPKPGTAARRAVKTVYTPRSTKTAIIGAGPAGLLTSRLSQIMGYSSPMTIIDAVPPGRPHIHNNKRNHPLLITTATLDALQLLDPRLYRRLLSLGRFDTYAGHLDWADKPVNLLLPREHPTRPFPRWINHLCLPRDAFAHAILTTPVAEIPTEVKAQAKLVQAGKLDQTSIPKNVLPQVGINLAKIHSVQTPQNDPEYLRTNLPVLKVVPESIYKTFKEKQAHSKDQTAQIKVPKALEFNLVIAADGKVSDVYASQYNTLNYQHLRTTPNDNVKVHGWCLTTAVDDMVGQTIDGTPFENSEHCWQRLNSRIFTRRIPGIRFTTFLMDYPPLHLANGQSYRPKEPTERPDWVYWELVVAKSIWEQSKLPLPTLPAVNNVQYHDRLGRNATEIDKLVGIENDKSYIDKGVFMGPHDPIDPKQLLSISPLVDHPLTRALINHTPAEGLTVERVMYNPPSHLNGSTFHDHVLYIGESACATTNDAFAADTNSIESAIITSLALAANNTTPPELLARRVSSMIDRAFIARAQRVLQRELDDDVYFGTASKARSFMASIVDKYFPAASKQEQYEVLYRWNPQRAFEIVATETARDILERNSQYRHSLQSGFLDGTTRRLDFGDVPLGDMNIPDLPVHTRRGVGLKDDGKINYKSLRQRAKERGD